MAWQLSSHMFMAPMHLRQSVWKLSWNWTNVPCLCLTKTIRYRPIQTIVIFQNSPTNYLVGTSGWMIRPTFNQSSVSWYNCVRSLTTSRNLLNITLLYVSQYPCIFSYFKQFSKLFFNISIDFSRILCLFITTAIFTGSECFW